MVEELKTVRGSNSKHLLGPELAALVAETKKTLSTLSPHHQVVTELTRFCSIFNVIISFCFLNGSHLLTVVRSPVYLGMMYGIGHSDL